MCITILYVVVVNCNVGTVAPAMQGVYVRSDISITCTSMTPPTWTKDGDELPDDVYISTEITIEINNVKVVHTGIYTCKGTDINGLEFTADSVLLVGG